MLVRRLKQSREGFLDRFPDAGVWRVRLFSAATYALWRANGPVMAAHCGGLVLDAGSGRGGWRGMITRHARDYESIDIAPRGGSRPTWVGNILDMPQVPDARYDTIVCHQVLEHVPRPWRALQEFRRILKPGGKLIVSVPHLSRRHELPNDYLRFTPEGLRALLAEADFEVIDCRAFGGVISFLHHQVSMIWPGLVAGVPVIGTLALLANAPLSWLAVASDAVLDRGALMPLGVLAVAERRP